MDFVVADIAAFLIAGGYALGGFLLWRQRRSYESVSSLGWLIFPIITLWVVFYGSLPFADDMMHRTWYVLLSRTAHAFSIVLLILVAALGRASRGDR